MEILTIILPSLFFPVVVVVFAVMLITKINRHTFAELIQHSGENIQMPQEIVRASELRYGFSRYKNVVKLAEQNGFLFIKIPLLPTIQIPYKELERVEKSTKRFKDSVFVLFFKEENKKPLAFALRENDLERFPQLQNLGSIEKQATSTKNQSDSKKPMDLPKIMDPTQPLNGDHVRNLVLVGTLLAGIIYFLSEWI